MSSLVEKVANLFHKKHEEHETHPSGKFATILREGGCPCRNIPDTKPHFLLDSVQDTHLKPKAKGEFDLIFEGPKAQAHFEIFAKNKDRFNDIISLYGEVTWSSQQSSKNNHGEERYAITGSFVSGQFRVRGLVDYGHIIKVALSRLYNKNSTIVNPKFSFFPPQINHKAVTLTCSPPQLVNMHISQSITNPAQLVWVLRDQSEDPQVYPTAWRVLNLTSSSETQIVSFYQQLALGVVTVSGSTVSTPLFWLETQPGIDYQHFASPNNLSFSPYCSVAPNILVTNFTGAQVDYAIGFTSLGGGSDPDTFDVTGVITATVGNSIILNNSGKAQQYKLYCNLPSAPTQGELITYSLPSDNQLANNVWMWSYASDVCFLLSETGGVYTWTQTG